MRHWAEYGIEAALLGTFMVSASAFSVLLDHPASPLGAVLGDPLARRVVGGIAMGMTAAALIYSPWGARSGAHMNPAVTLAFARLGKVARVDAAGYVAAQFAGGFLGMVTASALFGAPLGAEPVHWVVTRPGPAGPAAAFIAELAMTFVMMTVVLAASNHPRWSARTGLLAAALVALFIVAEAPVSGMSLNPARTLGPAVMSGDFTGLWIYFTAPPIGMGLAAELFVRRRGLHAVLCAKLHHGGAAPCIFHCSKGTP